RDGRLAGRERDDRGSRAALEARPAPATNLPPPTPLQAVLEAALGANPKQIANRHGSLQPANEVEPAQLPHAPDGFADDLLGHLGLAECAVDENDGDFANGM